MHREVDLVYESSAFFNLKQSAVVSGPSCLGYSVGASMSKHWIHAKIHANGEGVIEDDCFR